MPQQDAGAVQLMRRDDPPEVPQGYKMAMATLPGQRRIITLYRNGTCEGTLIEGMNGTVTAYDADGNFLNLNGHDLDRRGLFSALKKLGKWVAKTGKKAWVCLARLGTSRSNVDPSNRTSLAVSAAS